MGEVGSRKTKQTCITDFVNNDEAAGKHAPWRSVAGGEECRCSSFTAGGVD